LPALIEMPSPTIFVMRMVATLVILFSLYCYSSELERLGVALRPSHG
jgi:hypothetical protein